VTFNKFVPTLCTDLTDRLLCLLLRTGNTFLIYVWLPLGVQYVTEQLHRSLSRLITGFLARRFWFDSLKSMWNILWEVPLEKFHFGVLQFSQIRPFRQCSILFFLALGTPLQDEKADKCLGTFKQRNSLSDNVKALDGKILCHCLIHNSTSLSRTGFHALQFPIRLEQTAANPRDAFTYMLLVIQQFFFRGHRCKIRNIISKNNIFNIQLNRNVQHNYFIYSIEGYMFRHTKWSSSGLHQNMSSVAVHILGSHCVLQLAKLNVK
jgi:hypothetical protein